MQLRRVSLFVALSLLAACGHKKKQQKAEAAHDAAPPVAALTVDGKGFAALSRDLFVAKTPLAEAAPGLPPPSKWRMVTATDGKGRNLYLRDVATAYQHQTLKLYLGAHGKPSLGLFREPSDPPPPPQLRSLARAPTLFLDGLDAIEIRTHLEKAPPPPQARLQLRIGDAPPVAISQADLAGVKKTDPPGNRDDARGWRLRDVLAGRIPDGASPAIHVVADDGDLELPAGTLTDDAQLVYLKVNRRGLFRLQWWKDAKDRRTVAGELRGVSMIEISKDPGTPSRSAKPSPK